MALRSASVSTTSTPTLLTGGTTGSRAQSFMFTNMDGSTTVYVGDANVSASSGTPILAGQSLAIDLSNEDGDVYGFVASGTVDVRVLATNS